MQSSNTCKRSASLPLSSPTQSEQNNTQTETDTHTASSNSTGNSTLKTNDGSTLPPKKRRTIQTSKRRAPQNMSSATSPKTETTSALQASPCHPKHGESASVKPLTSKNSIRSSGNIIQGTIFCPSNELSTLHPLIFVRKCLPTSRNGLLIRIRPTATCWNGCHNVCCQVKTLNLNSP